MWRMPLVALILGGALGCGPGVVKDVYMAYDKDGSHRSECFRNDYSPILVVDTTVNNDEALVSLVFSILGGGPVTLVAEGGGDFDKYGVADPDPGVKLLTFTIEATQTNPMPDGRYKFDVYMTEGRVGADDEIRGSATFDVGPGCPCFPFPDCRNTGISTTDPATTSSVAAASTGAGGAGGTPSAGGMGGN